MLPRERIGICHRRIKLPGQGVTVCYNQVKATAYYTGLWTCGLGWVCPVCHLRIAMQRKQEIKAALGMGWAAVFVTWTIQHNLTDPLDELLGDLRGAVKSMKSGRAWKDLKAESGVIGAISTLEVRFGRHGWHPHIHEIMFFDVEPDIGDLQATLAARYRKKLEAVGKATYSESVKVELVTRQGLDDYFTKLEMADELTGGNIYKRGESVSPFGLLIAYLEGGDPPFGKRPAATLWLDYAEALKGKRWITWTKGLKELVGLDELTDEEIAMTAEYEELPDDLKYLFSDDWWEVIEKNELRYDVLAAAKLGHESLLSWVVSFLIPLLSEPPSLPEK